MYICLCNNITLEDLAKHPELVYKIASKCGNCVNCDDCDCEKSIDVDLAKEIAKLKLENKW